MCRAQRRAVTLQHSRISPHCAGATATPARETTSGNGSRILSRPRPKDRASCPSGVIRQPKSFVNDSGRYFFSRHGALAFRPAFLFSRIVATASYRS